MCPSCQEPRAMSLFDCLCLNNLLSLFCMKTGKYVELSVQDQISCVRGNKNCALGNLDTTYKYLELIGALSEECFPFVSQNATFYPKCPNECSNKQAELLRNGSVRNLSKRI